MSKLKPLSISFMDGYFMGGGVGTDIYCTYRIVTEKTVCTMPEAKIGFFSDVGSSYFLPKIRNKMGIY